MNLHPQSVHFPIAILLLAGGIYIFAHFQKKETYYPMAYLLHSIGVIGAIIGILTGRWASTDVNIEGEVKSILNQHEWLGYICLWLYALLWVWQYLRQKRMSNKESIGFLFIYVAVSCLLAYMAHLGGEMVYEYGISVR